MAHTVLYFYLSAPAKGAFFIASSIAPQSATTPPHAIPAYSLMSLQLVQQFQRDLEQLIQYGGTRNESSVRAACQELLRGLARSHDLELVPEVAYKAPGMKNTVKPDGTLKDALRQSRDYWESKDDADSLYGFR